MGQNLAEITKPALIDFSHFGISKRCSLGNTNGLQLHLQHYFSPATIDGTRSRQSAVSNRGAPVCLQ